MCNSCGTVFTKATAKFCAKCGAKKATVLSSSGAGLPLPAKGIKERPSSLFPSLETAAAAAPGVGELQPQPPQSQPRPGSGGRNAASVLATAAMPAAGTHRTRKGSFGSVVDSPTRRSSASGTMPFMGNTSNGLDKAGAKKKRQTPLRPSTSSHEAQQPPETTPPPLAASAIAEGSGGQLLTKRDNSVGSTTSPHHRDATALPEDRDGVSPPPTTQSRSPKRKPSLSKPARSQAEGADALRKDAATEEGGQQAGAGESHQSSAGATTMNPTEDMSVTMGSFKTIEASAEEEAQYTAWATLGPEGLTPEMLQTQNAKSELRSWRRGSLIGRGTYGSVYLGLLSDGSFYAVKCVELGGRSVADMPFNIKELVSLSREINMMQRLRHRNLCTFKGVLYDPDSTTISMFMEYVGGGSLSSIVKRFKPLPADVVRRWTRQLLTGLLYLHAQHIIHRDIKGDNVLIDTSASPESEAQVKLVDFGAARRLTDAVSQSRTVIGTPYWMAPEVVDVTGEGKGYSYKADVWSVGCTVAEMLTGRPPWPAKATAPAAIMMVASTEGMPTEVPREEATPGCYAFMLRCFVRDPEQRPTVEELLQDPWILGKTA